jgi:hypothetical protein
MSDLQGVHSANLNNLLNFLSQARWHAPIDPNTWKAEEGGLWVLIQAYLFLLGYVSWAA